MIKLTSIKLPLVSPTAILIMAELGVLSGHTPVSNVPAISDFLTFSSLHPISDLHPISGFFQIFRLNPYLYPVLVMLSPVESFPFNIFKTLIGQIVTLTFCIESKNRNSLC